MEKTKHKTESFPDPFEGLSDEEISELLEVFFEDIHEKTESLSSLIIEFEEQPENKQVINALFQIYHSMKGSIGTFGFVSLSEIVHKLEYLLEDIREKKLAVTQELIDLLLLTLDIFNKIVVKIKSRRSSAPEELQMNTLIDQFWRKEIPAVAPDITDKSKQEVIERLKEEVVEYLKLKSSKIDKIIALSSELILRKRFDAFIIRRLKEVHRIVDTNKAVLKKLRGMENYQQFALDKSGTPCDALEHSIGQLENNVNELIRESEFWNDSTAQLLDELQHEVLQTRMVEINEYFQQLKRTVRDLVKRENKKVKMLMYGLDTEIDRAIMEEIKDPVMHLIRNAVDHGIELPEERSARGKPVEASLKISAYPTGNEVAIEIADDGSGIDLEKVRNVAIEKSLYTQKEIALMSDQEVINIIFTPGFSTKGEADQVSGRGVGMDVVKSNIEKIHGIISVDTERGKGTKFAFKIPTTLSAFPAILIKAGTFYFYLQIIAVERIIRVPSSVKRPVGRIDLVKVNGSTMPFVYLGDYFGFQKSNENKYGTYIVIIRSGERCMALEVDECIDRHDIVLKSRPDIMNNVSSVAGISILADGQIAYVIEPSGILSDCKKIHAVEYNAVCWDLDNLVDVTSFPFSGTMEQEVFLTDAKESKKQLLNFTLKSKKFGIPVKDIVMVYNLFDSNSLEHLNEIYDSVLTLKDDKLTLIKREELKNPLKWERWKLKGSAVVINVNGDMSILIPEKLGTIDVRHISELSPVEKTGKWSDQIPDIVRIGS